MIPAMASPGQESESLNVRFLVDSMLAMVHTARPDDHLDDFNKRWLEYLGVTVDDVSGWKWGAFVHREDVVGTVAKSINCEPAPGFFKFDSFWRDRSKRATGLPRDGVPVVWPLVNVLPS